MSSRKNTVETSSKVPEEMVKNNDSMRAFKNARKATAAQNISSKAAGEGSSQVPPKKPISSFAGPRRMIPTPHVHLVDPPQTSAATSSRTVGLRIIPDPRILCALFGEYVDELNRFLSSGSIPHGVSVSQSIGIVGSGKNIGIEEDFMKLTPRCTAKSLDDNNRAETFVVLAKIAEIVEDGPWWYSACVCGRVVNLRPVFMCILKKSKFRVKVLVEDSTGVFIFVLFDREASYLLNKTCAHLFEQYLKDVDVVFGTQSPPIFQEIVEKTMLFKVLSRPVGMEKFKGTYPVRRICDDAAIVGMFELSGSYLSPEKAEFIPKGEGSFGESSKVIKSPNLGLTPSSCSELFAGSPQCTQKESSVVDLGVDEDAKVPCFQESLFNAVMDKLNEVDNSENSCDEVDESEEAYVVGLNRGSLNDEKDVKPLLKRLRRSLRLQFDEADESRGSGNDGSSGQGVN
ncbi:uncharacterized protein LOC110265286 [Arachis ipaensis]|uniref:uncharacterized protein LOC110265286 n=1 Tax=Arachis ipaensis TaxID=130454 RepID=UPI000A2B341C|nr:uncharacterized protein LOC110265286 [Arachis ipaensis]